MKNGLKKLQIILIQIYTITRELRVLIYKIVFKLASVQCALNAAEATEITRKSQILHIFTGLK